MKYIFANCIAAGPVDWKRPLTAPGQPGIREAFAIIQEGGKTIAELHDLPATSELGVLSHRVAQGFVVVGHSVEFHYGALRAAMIPWGIDPCDGRAKTVCTMLSLANCGVKRGGRNGWPSFQEACDYFQITRAGVETAEDNCRCLVQVFRGMEAIGVVPEPKIWKERKPMAPE